MLYTCKNRSTPTYIDSNTVPLPIMMANMDQPVWKNFRTLLGIIGEDKFPHHARKITRDEAKFHEVFFKPGTYEVAWVEFICMEPNDFHVYYRDQAGSWNPHHDYNQNARATANADRRMRKAKALITRITDLPGPASDDGPPAFEAKPGRRKRRCLQD